VPPEAVPGITLRWQLDALSAFFALVIVAISAPVTVFAIAHGRHHAAFRGAGACYALFITSMLAVVVAADAYTFLLAWETMSLASFALVLSDHRHETVRRAAWVYLVMTHAATASIIATFLLLARTSGSLLFTDWTAAAGTLDTVTATAVFVLGLVGFGTKAGMVPLHVWLPRAHPVAPAHVSALMSGVMIKLGIYGLVRLCFEWLPPGPAWWGGLILTLGACSAVLGMLYALMQHDLKRLLAYCSVENIGIILLGLGAGVIARGQGAAAVALLGLTAALFHVANHAAIKALLFMGAGAVGATAGTHDLDRLGGLARRLPSTAAAFLVGSAAISALPPLNGFASEWLTFQALLGLARAGTGTLVALPSLVAGGMLALASALAVACFVKAYGVAFLGLPRSAAADAATEVAVLERVPMLLLAAACVALGLGAAYVTAAIASIVSPLVGATPSTGPVLAGAGDTAAGHLFVPGIALALLLLAPLPFVLARLLGRVRTRVVPTWACGIVLHPVHQYTSIAFAKPIRLMFRDIVRPVRELEIVRSGGSRFVSSISYRATIAPIFERYLYASVMHRLVLVANVVRRVQNGSLQTYLAYLFVALVIGLVVAR